MIIIKDSNKKSNNSIIRIDPQQIEKFYNHCEKLITEKKLPPSLTILYEIVC